MCAAAGVACCAIGWHGLGSLPCLAAAVSARVIIDPRLHVCLHLGLPACVYVYVCVTHSDDAGSITGTGGDAVDTSPQDLHTRLAGEFNRRWQLMSLMIDHACR